MELYFETYLIIALVYVIMTVTFLTFMIRTKRLRITSCALLLLLGFLVPYFLIFLQRAYGSTAEINRIIFEFEYDPNVYITFVPTLDMAYRVYVHNFGFIVLSIMIGILLGFLLYRLMRRNFSFH